jgi:SAM-dependent methyltransferase
MKVTPGTSGEQATLWNGPAGRAWVETQDVLEEMYKPFEPLLAEAVCAGSRQTLLDVGCGTGATTLAAARRLGANGDCTGIDVSEPMIAAARAAAAREALRARFIVADAQVYPFEPASVDVIVSRFGVMFFDDPVAAFTNLRRAGRPAAGLRLIAWRSADQNPFMTTAERAAAPLLPDLPVRKADAPGQFAFANADRVRGILSESGWAKVEFEPIDVACRLPAHELIRYVSRLGPVGLALQQADEATRTRVLERVRPAFDHYAQGDELRFTAACWLVTAQAGPGR